MNFDTAFPCDGGIVSHEPLRIYTGLLGQIGDIVMFTATVRRIKELFPNSQITFAVSERYRSAGELVAGLPYIDDLFVAQLYFDKLPGAYYLPWHLGWPVDLRGDDEIEKQSGYDIVFETRPRHRRMPWWEYGHQVEEYSHMVKVPGPINKKTDICIPANTRIPVETKRKIVLHNDPSISDDKSWPWENVRELVYRLGQSSIILLGYPGPEVEGCIDLRGQTTLAEAAAIIQCSRCYIGIDSGLMWIAGSLEVKAVGLYGTSYIPAYQAIQPVNPNAHYLQAEGPMSGISVDSVYYNVCQCL